MTLYNTLFLLLIFSFAISSIAMWVNWYLNPHEIAVRYWAIALTIILFGCALLAYSRSHLPDTESMIPFGVFQLLRDLAKSLNALSWIVLWAGTLKFMGQPVPGNRFIAGIWLGFFALFLVAHPLGIPGAWGVAWISTIVTCCSLMILYEILKPGIGGIATWFAGAGFLLAAVTWGVRAVMSFVDLSRSVDSGFDSGVIFGAIVSAYACMLSMVLLTNQRLIDRLDDLESRDPLTKVLNRYAFTKLAESLLIRASRNQQDCSLVLLNVDNFKEINDEHGQLYGDKALCQLAEVFMQALGRQDLVARYGGDQFMFFLFGKNTSQAQILANRLQILLQQNLVESVEGAFQVRASMGVSGLDGEMSLEQMIQFANIALYQAKSSDRDQIVLYDEELTGPDFNHGR